MPYYRKRTSTYRRRPTYRRRTGYKTTQKIARREVTKQVNKMSPLMWTDIIFNGGNVNTTPTVHSFGRTVADFISVNQLDADWPARAIQNGTSLEKQATVKLTYVHYQLRYQQDVENIESSNTFRALMYSFIDTWSENNVGILAGGDIDLPPNTEKVKSMYFDRLRSLRAGQFEETAGVNEPSPTPGTAIIKGNKRVGKQFKMHRTSGEGSIQWEEEDVRFESQSDSVGNGLQLYGFIRLYFRIYN